MVLCLCCMICDHPSRHPDVIDTLSPFSQRYTLLTHPIRLQSHLFQLGPRPRLHSARCIRPPTISSPRLAYALARRLGINAPTPGARSDRADPPTSWHSVWSFQEFANKKLQTLGKGSVSRVFSFSRECGD